MSPVAVLADLDAVANAAADDFITRARRAIKHHGEFHVALSGGSTPKRLFEVLVARGHDAVPWDQIVLWWGDERCVPPDHPDSNYGMAARLLIEPLGLDAKRVHRMEGEREPEAAARDYEAALCSALGSPPILDLVLLGMGKDGHTASLFPGSPGLAERERFVIANPVDSPLTGGKTTRITFTFTTLAAASRTRFLVVGADKADALAGVLEGPPDCYPSQLVTGPDVRWFVDEAAAAKLRSNHR